MEWPKRARTAELENGVLTLDGNKQFDIPELTIEIMERLAGYTRVGFHVKGYPVTDEMLIPFTAHKNMVTVTPALRWKSVMRSRFATSWV